MEFREDDLVRLGGRPVCASCKPLFLQKLREGVNVEHDFVYAGFWIRVGAKIIDQVILVVGGFIIGYALGATGILGRNYGLRYNVLFNFIFMAIGLCYQTYFLGAFGATPGKMACGLRVARPDGEKIGYGRAFGRFFGELVSSIILCIGYLMVAFDPEKRALHDRICDTRVIKKT
ncbi:MAG TPA: RDD family protein [Thermodesulfobacteriota bacterium]|nr:RDD family protein [Thermodesulfobacteriota bacterium]